MGQEGVKELDFYLNSDTLLLDLLNVSSSVSSRVISKLPHSTLKQVLLDARIKDIKGNTAILRKRLKNYLKNRQNPDVQAKKKADAFKYAKFFVKNAMPLEKFEKIIKKLVISLPDTA